MINGRKPEPFRSCPFRMMKDIFNNCIKDSCEWWDKENGQCVIWTIAVSLQ